MAEDESLVALAGELTVEQKAALCLGSDFWHTAPVEAAEMALNTDESFIDLIDKKAGGVYSDVPGASTQLIYRRVSG